MFAHLKKVIYTTPANASYQPIQQNYAYNQNHNQNPVQINNSF